MILLVLFVLFASVALYIYVVTLLLNVIPKFASALPLQSDAFARWSSAFFRILPYRLRGSRIYICNVIRQRWRLILAVTAGIAIVTAICSLVLPPQYSATCVIKEERDLNEIN